MDAQNKVIVRFPPSPTGFLHVGSVRTALYNYLFARKHNGKFVLRIEDTDKERSKKEYEQNIYEGLKWLGMEYDNNTPADPVLRQSERTEVYKKYLRSLIEKGFAYEAEEQKNEDGTPKLDGKKVVRFKNPNTKVVFDDLIRGQVEIDTTDLGDFVIARNIDDPLYHLAVVVDDLEAGVTHVIRGEDHISNTPRQILILEAIGGARPIYAHIPLVLAEDKSKLSKRKHGEAVSLKHYIEKSYERDALLNFLTLVGWNPGDDREIFTLEELVNEFDISKVQKKSGIFNIEKLNWINKEHILRQSEELKIENLKSQIGKTKHKDDPKFADEIFFKKFFDMIIERIHRWGEVSEWLEAGEYDYLFEKPAYEKDLLIWKKSDAEKTKSHLQKISEIIALSGDINSVWDQIFKYAEEQGKGDVLWPLRTALSGRRESPDPRTLLDLLGTEESLARVRQASEML